MALYKARITEFCKYGGKEEIIYRHAKTLAQAKFLIARVFNEKHGRNPETFVEMEVKKEKS